MLLGMEVQTTCGAAMFNDKSFSKQAFSQNAFKFLIDDFVKIVEKVKRHSRIFVVKLLNSRV